MPRRHTAPLHQISSRPVVLITTALPRSQLSHLAGLARIVMGPPGGDTMPRARVLQMAPQLAGIISQGELTVDAELLDRAPSLRIVASASVGVDKLDLSLMAQRGVYATNAPTYFVEATADYTLGAILALMRRLTEADRYVRSGRWHRFQPGAWDGGLLKDKVLGIVGYGAIGRAVARRATGFGLKVIYYSRTPSKEPGYTPLNRLLSKADIVSLHVPLTVDTYGLMNSSRLDRMKRGAYLINTARGRVVDEAALIRVLNSGQLAGAALDVFAQEPQVPAALRRHNNVLLTPHLGGGTRESRLMAWSICLSNVARVLAGQYPTPLQNEPISTSTGTTPARQYRAQPNK